MTPTQIDHLYEHLWHLALLGTFVVIGAHPPHDLRSICAQGDLGQVTLYTPVAYGALQLAKAIHHHLNRPWWRRRC